MDAFISKEVLDGITAARTKSERRKNRLSVHTGEHHFPVLKYWGDGFSVAQDVVPKLRGLVDLYDGSRHVAQCLIIGMEPRGDTMIYAFKRRTAANDKAPLDYERAEDAPIALLR